MKRTKILAVALTLLLLLLSIHVALAHISANYEILWSRFASGGGERESPTFLTQDIVGHWITGSSASTNAQIVADFYWGEEAAFRQLLPIVVR